MHIYSCGGFNTPTLCVVTKGIKAECNHLMRTTYPDACVGVVDFRRKRKVKIQRASDRIFTALWVSIGFIIALDFVLAFLGQLDFTISFFIIGILVSVGCVVSGTLIQKKASFVMYAEGLCWLLCAVFCLFVKPYTAPLIISAATFVLLSIPAFAGLLIIRNKKNYGRK